MDIGSFQTANPGIVGALFGGASAIVVGLIAWGTARSSSASSIVRAAHPFLDVARTSERLFRNYGNALNIRAASSWNQSATTATTSSPTPIPSPQPSKTASDAPGIRLRPPQPRPNTFRHMTANRNVQPVDHTCDQLNTDTPRRFPGQHSSTPAVATPRSTNPIRTPSEV
jgi:hypothetical protein